MTKKTYWKDIWKSVGSSKGRFLSIMLLMMLGSFALVGLKVTAPNMRHSADNYLREQNTMDLTVIASMGLSKDDQKELASIKDSSIEFGYMTDVTLKNTNKAIRIFSTPKRISKMQLIKGKLPQTTDQIALSSPLSSQYKIGDEISFTQHDHNKILKKTVFKVSGFINSPEIWSTINLGSSTAGDGNLSDYAVTVPQTFDVEVPSIARLRYKDVAKFNSFSKDYKKTLETKQKQLDKLLKDNPKIRLTEIKDKQQKEIDANSRKLKDNQVKLTNSQKQLLLAQKELSQKEEILGGLPDNQKSALLPQLELTKKTLADQSQKLSQAESELRDKQKDIDTAQKQLNNLLEPTYDTYTRTTLPGGNGYMVYAAGADSVSKIGDIFPVVLYLVAALVVFTTMTRFVDEERNNSAILKALGYHNGDVIRKFVIYGFVASITGTIIGLIAGHYILSPVITRIMIKSTTLTEIHYDFFWSYTCLSLVVGFIAAVLPAYLIAKNELSEKTAQLLLPKPPVNGSKILLERLTFFWNKLSFTHKVTVRNIFRYKQRMLMTIFGVAGSVALLFAGLGIQSSLSKVVDNQFKRITPYNMMVIEKQHVNDKDHQKLSTALQNAKIDSQRELSFAQLSLVVPNTTQTQSVSLLSSSQDNFGKFIHIINIGQKKEINLPQKGVLISQKLARFYHVKKGQNLTITDEEGRHYNIKIADIIEVNIGHYLMMRDSVYRETFKDLKRQNAHLINLKDSSQKAINDESTALLSLNAVYGLIQNSAMIKTVYSIVDSLSGAMMILTLVAVLLAVVILYNLTNINVSERIRELSTIKVLGFYNKEVTFYIYRETIILSIVGVILGLIAGFCLHDVIMNIIGSDDILFVDSVDWSVYAIPIVVIIIILIILGCLVSHILKKVDMLEALKSVD